MLKIIFKIHKILTPDQRSHYAALQLMFAVTAIIQVAGVASLAPFIALLANPSAIHTNAITSQIYAALNCRTDGQFLMYLAAAIMLFIIVSNAVVALTTWLMFRFAFKLGAEIQNSTYKSYLSKDFVYYGKTNSSRMISVLTQEIPRYVYMALQPFLVLSSQVFVGAIILGGLIYIDIYLAVVATLIVGGGYLLVFRLLKERLSAHGYNLWAVNNQKLKLLSESLGGIKEIRLLGTESVYTEQLNTANLSMLRSQALIGLSADLPKFIIETIVFCALLGLALYLLAKHGNSAEVISIMSLYAMAGYKLLPAAQSIYKSSSQIKANAGALDEFIADTMHGRTVTITPADDEKRTTFNGDIKLTNVSYRYPETEFNALSDINLRIPRNSIVALVGTSGAGKSTLADLILGMLQPTEGKFYSGDTEITRKNIPSWQRNLGYVPQNIFIIDDTITANIAFGVSPEKIDMIKVKRAAEMANISTFVESLPQKYDYVVGERGALLSGGQRQRIGIARALYHDASILVLDEATSALDNVTEAEVISTINELKAFKTIIMIAHRLSTIRAADLVVMMKNGWIQEAGTFDELALSNTNFREMLHLSTEETTPEKVITPSTC